MSEYKVIRTLATREGLKDLDTLLNLGWEIQSSNVVVGIVGYIEYILKKKV